MQSVVMQYSLECWAEYADRPVQEMPEYLGWADRDAKRMQYVQHHKRKPHSIDRADQRFSNPSVHTRVIFCDFPRCMKPCKGVQSGYFLTAKLPAHAERQALWESGSLDMTFYCQRHYEEVTGQVAPAWAKKRPKAKAWPRAAQHRRLARSKPMLSALLLQLRNGRHVRGMRRPMGHGRDGDRMMSW